MKTKLIFYAITIALMVFACARNAVKTVDLEKEKAAIEKLLKENYDQLIKADKAEYISFTRKYNLEKAYSFSNDSLFFYNYPDTTDERLYASNFSGSFRWTDMKHLQPIIIKVFPEGKSAYCMSKDLFSFKYDSAGLTKTGQCYVTYLQVLEKNDSIWRFGDYMQSIKRKR